ncbi:hypothetical protein AgCh_031223 [Apium graveolens]
MLTGRQVAEILDSYENSFGGVGKKRKVSCDINPWNKKSMFFDLPYWKDNLTRHNLDVMHIEKNICDSVLGTLLNIGGKMKDHLAARLDLQDQGIRKALYHMPSIDGKHLEFRAAKFDMTNKEKEIFCSVLENAKFPYGFASNISKCVQDMKVTGYKSHDAHKYVRNRSKPKGSIAEGYLAHECLTFCARFLNDDQNKSVNESPSVNAEKGGYAINLGKSKYGKDINLGEDTWIVAHRKHHKLLDSNLENIAKSKRYKTEKTHTDADGHRQCESLIAPQWTIHEDQEIGGLYVNRRGWTIVTDDQGVTEVTRDKSDVSFYIDNTVEKSIPPMNQMHPFVIIRPRSSPFKVVEKNVDKRTFVTLKDINNEKE